MTNYSRSVRYLRKNKPGEKMETELNRYRFCVGIFLAMDTALALIICIA